MSTHETLMHLDGCHFYCWVIRQPDGAVVLTFDEREDSDLRLHGRFTREKGDEPCDRCKALGAGASAKHDTRVIDDYPSDPKEAFGKVWTVIAEEDEKRA